MAKSFINQADFNDENNHVLHGDDFEVLLGVSIKDMLNKAEGLMIDFVDTNHISR
jgi:hypothetical protein